MSEYWAEYWRRSVNRRGFVRGSAAMGAGLFGLAVAGCSSNNNNSGNKATTAASATKAAAASAAAPASPTRAATGTPSTTGAASPTGAATTSGSPAASSVKLTAPVSFAFLSSFSGPLAPIYAEFVSGAQLAIDEINTAGGIGGQKLTMVQADDQSNPAQVPAATLGVVDKKIGFCMGPIGSNAISASQALSAAKIIQCGYSDNPALTDTSKYPYSFRFVWSAEQSSKLIVDYLTKTVKATKIAVLGENTVYGQTDLPTTTKYMDSVGLKPTVNEYFAPGTADFTPLLRKAQDAGTQAIIWWTQGGPEGATVLKNMNDLKLDIPIVGIGLDPGHALKGVLPDSQLEKVWNVSWKRLTYSDSEPISAKVKTWNQKLGAAGGLGKTGSGGSAPFYDFVYFIKAGIEGTGGVDSATIVKWMESHPYDGLVAAFNGITAKDHSTVKDDSISLGVDGSWNATDKVFQKRPPGL